VTQIRIALTRMPRMLREILEESIAAEATMRIVGDAADAGDLAAVAARREADVIVSSVEPSEEELRRAFGTRPELRVIVLDPAGDRGVLHELRPERVTLGQASPQNLIAAIQEHAGWSPVLR
jgi:DNA-binding NarL/FixJ family response regulator